jgi:preprotein translocase subunit SecD
MSQNPYPAPQYDVPPPKRGQGPLVLIGVLVLVLIVALAVGTLVLIRANNDDKPEATSTTAQRSNAVQFRRVITTEQAVCVTPRTEDTYCDSQGVRYTLDKVALDGTHVQDATAGNSDVSWMVTLRLDEEGARLFEQLTADLAAKQPPNNQLAIVVDDQVISAPTVQSAIPGGQIQITGNFTQAEAEKLAADITR